MVAIQLKEFVGVNGSVQQYDCNFFCILKQDVYLQHLLNVN